MESGLHHQPRTIRTKSNVLWAHQLASNLSSNDKRHLQRWNKGRMGIHLHGQYPNPHWQWHCKVSKISLLNSSKIRRKWPVPQTGKIRLQTKKNQVPRCHLGRWNNPNGPVKNQGCCQLACPQDCQGHTSLPRVYRILLLLCPQLF